MMKSRSDSVKKSKEREEERSEGEKGLFSRTFGSECDEFPRKSRSAWEIEIFGTFQKA
jgi:hypothetical protein